MQTDEHGRDQCCVRQWNDERGAMTEFWVPSAEMRVWEHPTGVGRATGVAANPTDITEPRRMYYVNTPTNDDQPYVREDDAGLIAGRMLQATANYNIADDPESCVGGLPYKVFPGLDVAVLEVRKGDLIRFIKMTSHTNVGYGELISSALLQAGKEQAPTMGCFSTLRCVYAKSTDARPVPKGGVPGGTSGPPEAPPKPSGPPDVPPKPKLAPAKRKADPDTIEAVNDGDEATIRKMILQGFEQKDFEKMIMPAEGTEKKKKAMKAVANSFAAIAKKRLKVTPAPAEEVKSTSEMIH